MRKVLAVITAVLATLGVAAVPAGAASGTTLHFFGKETSSVILDPSGQPVTDPNATPQVGGTLISTDDDYLGNHKKHSAKIYASDHLLCTFKTVDPTTFAFTALCDAQLSLPGGMLIADRETISFGGDKVVVPVTGGTGKYDKVKHGTVTSVNYSDKSDNSDFTVTF